MASKLHRVSWIPNALHSFSELTASRTVFKHIHYARTYASGADKVSRRKEILAEFKKGYFADIKEFQRTGGKSFMAPNSLIEEEKAVRFPTFTAKSLSGKQVDLSKAFSGHVTLVLIAMRGIAQPMCDAYREPYCNAFKDYGNAKYYEINAVDSMFYGMFRTFISGTLRKQIPKERHDNYLCYYGSTRSIRNTGFVENTIVGHAFLVDSKGLMRWRACAKPTDEEIESLINCTKRILT